MAAASSLIRWGGTAAVLGGLSTSFVSGLLPPPVFTQRRGIAPSCSLACFVPIVTLSTDTRPKERSDRCYRRRPRLLDSPRPQQDEESPWAGLQEWG